MKIFITIFITFNLCLEISASEAYFEASEKEIQIQTDFNGKEIIIFGVIEDNKDTIIIIDGPKRDTKMMKKERILGFWFNSKKVIYKSIPSLFFIASSSPINKILKPETIVKEKLFFNELLINAVTQRDFIDQKKLKSWNKNLINIKKNENLFKEYNFDNIDNKLFQTRVFFPSNTIPGQYIVTIYQIKDFIITNRKNKIIVIKKSGIGEKIFEFAHSQPAAYGLLSIIFAIMCGLFAATIFRRL